MILSDRLQVVVDMVTPGHKVADVGCDHAYTSIYLIKNKISNKVLAMDANPGPIKKARKNIYEEYGLEDKIETRLSDGLENLAPGEVDTVIIAGMGGGLTCKILQEGADKLDTLKELVLQPQSGVDLVRKLLERLGFPIVKERMLIEDGKYYVVIKAEKGQQSKIEKTTKTEKVSNQQASNQQSSNQQASVRQDSNLQDSPKQPTSHQALIKESHHLYGQYLLENRDPVLHKYLVNRKETLETVKVKIKKVNPQNAKVRISEINQDLKYVKTGLSYYDT